MKTSRPLSATSFCRKIPARLDEADSLCLSIRELLHANGLPELCFPVELLARECVNNAVNHGNQDVADKLIVVRLSLGRRWIRLQVCDSGAGFQWRKASLQGTDTSRPSGRGLQLCAMYAERVRFNRCGNQITLWISKKSRMGKADDRMAAYVIEQTDKQGSVMLTGDLTAVLVPDLQVELKKMLSKGVRELVFDLASTVMLDSSGMGLLIAAANSLAPERGQVRVTNVCPDIFRLLQSMRLTSRLNVTVRAS